MQEYLKVQYPYETHIKLEFPIFGESWKCEDLKALKGYKMIIMVRDKVDFLWSFYNYFSLDSVPFEQFLDMPFTAYNMKGLTPLQQCDYEKWIEPFRKYNPCIVAFEDVIKLPDFPHNQVTKTPNKPAMPQESRNIALDRLNNETGCSHLVQCSDMVFG